MTNEMHVHNGMAYGHEKAFCPLTASDCKGESCPMAIKITEFDGYMDYPGGYRCGMCSQLNRDKWSREWYTPFDADGNRWIEPPRNNEGGTR